MKDLRTAKFNSRGKGPKAAKAAAKIPKIQAKLKPVNAAFQKANKAFLTFFLTRVAKGPKAAKIKALQAKSKAALASLKKADVDKGKPTYKKLHKKALKQVESTLKKIRALKLV